MLRNFLEIPYDELEELNLEAKEKVVRRTSDDELRDHYLRYLQEEKRIKAVTVCFTDFVGFTLSSEKLPARELVTHLHRYFTEFDNIVARYGLEKLKTIGDAYMFVAGMPEENPAHAVNAVLPAAASFLVFETEEDSESSCITTRAASLVSTEAGAARDISPATRLARWRGGRR